MSSAQSSRDVLRYIDTAYTAALLCMAYSYTYVCRRTGERFTLHELRAMHGDLSQRDALGTQ